MIAFMAETERREHERIEIVMPTRLWLKEARKGREIVFEGHAKTCDLSIGGTFLESDYLLPVGFPLNLEIYIGDGDILAARGEVVHRIERDEGPTTGMGIIFTEVDARNRERLLRFFVSERIRDFYEEKFVVEFPHLGQIMSLQDVALVINLWEDKEGRIASLHTSVSDRELTANRQAEVRATRRRGTSPSTGA